MRISIGKFVLCGDTETEYPADTKVSGSQQVQPAPLLRGTRQLVFNRGNRISRLPFRVTREHASYRAACEYALKHEAEIPTTGKIKIEMSETSGAVTVLWAISGVLESWECAEIVGCSTVHQYTIVCGGFTKTESEA